MIIYSTQGDLAPQLEELNRTEDDFHKDIIPLLWINGTFQSENNVERWNKPDNETIT